MLWREKQNWKIQEGRQGRLLLRVARDGLIAWERADLNEKEGAMWICQGSGFLAGETTSVEKPWVKVSLAEKDRKRKYEGMEIAEQVNGREGIRAHVLLFHV